MTSRLSKWISGLALLFLLVVLARTAEAHANLLQSIPEENAILNRQPVQVELRFSEPLEPTFSTIEVLDSSGQRVDNGDAEVDPSDRKRMTASLHSIPDGIYIVSWKALSSVDSHITTGAFPFAVGDVDAAALATAAEDSGAVRVSSGEVIARWLTFLSVMALAGGAIFILLVWQPAMKITNLEDDVHPPWLAVARIALLILLVVGTFWLIIQARQVVGDEFIMPWNPAIGQVLFNTRFGVMTLARFTLALILLWLLPRAVSPTRQWIFFVLSLLLLLTISLGSHAAAQPKPILPILADWLHLLAASIWVGGLIHLLVGLFSSWGLDAADRTRLTSIIIPRFSSVALISVSILVITGSYASLLGVGSLDGLTGTIYGRTLLFKLLLVLLMIILGAVNLLVTSPRMKRAANAGSDDGQVDRFRRLVLSEVTLGVTVLLSVGLLTTLPQARIATATPKLSDIQEVDDLAINLEVTPGRSGLNTFLVEMTNDGQPLTTAWQVSLQFTPTTADLPPSRVDLTNQEDGVFSTQGGYLALPDDWQIQVAIRRTDAFDTFANFDFKVGSSSPTDIGRSQSVPWHQVSGILLLVAAAASLLAVRSILMDRKGATAFGGTTASLLFLAGVLVFSTTPGGTRIARVNPIPPNPDSVANGEKLYIENCIPCHGVTGAGDGPVGRTLNPPPADLTQHTAPGVHSDGRLFDWITNGFPDSVMPAFNDHLTDEQRWHVVNYIRTLNKPN